MSARTGRFGSCCRIGCFCSLPLRGSQGFSALLRWCVCGFFSRRANKKGAPLVPILALPTSLANREISVLHLFECIAALVCIHTRDRLKMLRVHFAVAGFREMPLSVRQITTRLAKPRRRQQGSANGSSAALLENAQMFPPFYMLFRSCVK